MLFNLITDTVSEFKQTLDSLSWLATKGKLREQNKRKVSICGISTGVTVQGTIWAFRSVVAVVIVVVVLKQVSYFLLVSSALDTAGSKYR